MTKEQTYIWVAPEFKKKFKAAAALRGLSMTEYSRELSKDIGGIEQQLDEIKRRTSDKKKFDFSF